MKWNARVRLLMILQLVSMMLVFAGAAFAADAISLPASEPYTIYYTTNGAEPTVLPIDAEAARIRNEKKNKDLKNKLQKKYDLDKDMSTINLEHTQNGPKGRIYLMRQYYYNLNNKMTTPIISINQSSIVHNFMTEEAELLGIADLSELQEIINLIDELGISRIEYKRFIGQIPLEEYYIQFFVKSNGEISSVSANLFPAPPELYEAVKKETISEVRARAIAETALRELNYDANTNLSIRKHMRASKVAISTPPYVLWKVESYWNIFIDAFSGTVVKKVSNVFR